jgi:double-stranded uracil-DNA glycosylase
LERKIVRFKPPVVALIGVTLFRSLFGRGGGVPVRLGLQRERFHLQGARVFVLPNPSGRNANFSYAEMLTAFRALRRAARQRRDAARPKRAGRQHLE